MVLITPTELEARLAVNKDAENLVVLSEQLLRKAECRNLIMTLGADGVLISNSNLSIPDDMSTDRIGALNSKPQDVAGAGDSLFCMAALALTAGADIWTAGLLGSVASACQVSRVGNTPLTATEAVHMLEKGIL
jgi:sugar/nucleoside kinase (ribokinase family)